MKRIYVDNGSTSFPKAPGVGESIKEYIEKVGCNISRGGYEPAYDLYEKVTETRILLKDLFNFDKERNVVFVPSVTFALNQVLAGLSSEGDHIIISSMEHNAVARTAEALKKKGVEVTAVRCEGDGSLDLDDLRNSFRSNTVLGVMAHASNVSGTLQDIDAIGEIFGEKGVPFVLDAAQSAGAVNIDFRASGLSALCVPGHKGLLGPQGIGAMLVSDELAEELRPVIYGGTGSVSDSLEMPDFMPDKFEAGTLNLPGIVGLRESLRFVMRETPERILAHERILAERFIRSVSEFSGVRVVGPWDIRNRVGVVSLDFKDMDNAQVAYELDNTYGVMTRVGLHCAPLAHKTLGTYPEGTVRFSFGYFNTTEEVDFISESLKKILYKGGH